VWFTNWRQEIYEHRLYADLVKDPFLKLLHRNYLIIVVPPLILTALIDWRIPVFFFALPSIITLHSGGLTNTIGHMWGYRNFDTTDKSTNNTLGQWLFGFPGAMLHNNHHAFPDEYNYKMSEKWYETDFLNVFIIEKFLRSKQ
jgi:stearoyl-CoA desaturase (delta-9 desaturase)